MVYIVSTPDTCFGRPRIAGTRIAVKNIVIEHIHNGMPLELYAYEFKLSPAAVYAAISYYYDHKEEIDNGIEADKLFVEEFMKEHHSTLRPKQAA